MATGSHTIARESEADSILPVASAPASPVRCVRCEAVRRAAPEWRCDRCGFTACYETKRNPAWRVRLAGLLLLLTGTFGLLIELERLAAFWWWLQAWNPFDSLAGTIGVLLRLALYGLILRGGIRLRALRDLRGARIAALAALAPCNPAFLPGLAAGSFTLFVLARKTDRQWVDRSSEPS